MNLISFIYPQPELSKNIVISFVPIVLHPYKTPKRVERKLMGYVGEEQHLKANQYYYDHTYI